MEATKGWVGGMVPEVLDFFNPNWGQPPYGPINQDIPSALFLQAVGPMFHSLKITFSPHVMIFAIGLMLTFLLLCKPQAWQLLQKFLERVERIKLPGACITFGPNPPVGAKPSKLKRKKTKSQNDRPGTV